MIGILLLAGGLLAVMAAKKAPTSDGGRDAIRALKNGDDVALRKAADRFTAVGDVQTAAVLNLEASRMADNRQNKPVVSAPTLDPDNTGSPGIAELVARLAAMETRIMSLIGWATAFASEGMPKTAAMLQRRAMDVQSVTPGLVAR
jgi:hypothetical protein